MWVLRFFLFISKGVLLLTAMTTILWLTAVVILGCVLFQRLSGKVGVPALLFFIGDVLWHRWRGEDPL